MPIQGKDTKGSAVYVDGLAHALAVSFHKALSEKLRAERHQNERRQGLENRLCNEEVGHSEMANGFSLEVERT